MFIYWQSVFIYYLFLSCFCCTVIIIFRSGRRWSNRTTIGKHRVNTLPSFGGGTESAEVRRNETASHSWKVKKCLMTFRPLRHFYHKHTLFFFFGHVEYVQCPVYSCCHYIENIADINKWKILSYISITCIISFCFS